MDEKMNVLLKKINIDEDSYQYFQDAKLTKIKINCYTPFISDEAFDTLILIVKKE